jgi:hypothetical protein
MTSPGNGDAARFSGEASPTKSAVSPSRGAARVLRILLTLTGIAMTLALPTALLPVEWMAAVHLWLGLGEMPRGPIVEYLARSCSLLYGYEGCLFLYLARDPLRHTRLIGYLGWVTAGFSLAMFAVDAAAGLPLSWTLSEGPPAAVLGVAIALLARAAVRRP